MNLGDLVSNKPVLKTKAAYDYNECRNYLQAKYGYDEMDVLGKLKEDYPNEIEYCNFWHWVCNRYNCHNGCYLTFSKETVDEIEEEWVKTIYSYYLIEFAHGQDEVTFYVHW